MLQPRGASAPEVAEKFVVLVVEENAVIRSANAERLRAAGFEVLEAANSAEAERVLKSTTADALFVPYGVDDHCAETVALIRTPPLLLLQFCYSWQVCHRPPEPCDICGSCDSWASR